MEQSEPLYTRGVNPTVSLLRKKIAALEGAEDALVWSSGAAAITASIMSVVKQGDHVVCVQHPYSWAKYLLNDYLPKFGVSCSFVDGTSIENFSAAIQESTRLIYLESPNSFTFELQDLKGIAALAKEKNIITICDNSYSGPLAQSPLQFGIDMVIHSATKYLNGHSDVVAGVVCSNKERIQHLLKSEYMTLGSICSPFEAWLILRGLRTLKLRFEHSAKSALVLADKLHAHPKIKSVIYPFHPSFPQFELAKKQMQNGNGLLTIRLHASSIAQVENLWINFNFFILSFSF
jgi:cystathionine beta-lyase/cystathionine gamma-synthase